MVNCCNLILSDPDEAELERRAAQHDVCLEVRLAEDQIKKEIKMEINN